MSPSELPQDKSAHRIDRPVPLRERVYQAIQELIISRQLAPGQHLVESELAELLGVSRQPIREALQLLSSEGWVDLSSGPSGTTLILSVPLTQADGTPVQETPTAREAEDPTGWGEL